MKKKAAKAVESATNVFCRWKSSATATIICNDQRVSIVIILKCLGNYSWQPSQNGAALIGYRNSVRISVSSNFQHKFFLKKYVLPNRSKIFLVRHRLGLRNSKIEIQKKEKRWKVSLPFVHVIAASILVGTPLQREISFG